MCVCVCGGGYKVMFKGCKGCFTTSPVAGLQFIHLKKKKGMVK